MRLPVGYEIQGDPQTDKWEVCLKLRKPVMSDKEWKIIANDLGASEDDDMARMDIEVVLYRYGVRTERYSKAAQEQRIDYLNGGIKAAQALKAFFEARARFDVLDWVNYICNLPKDEFFRRSLTQLNELTATLRAELRAISRRPVQEMRLNLIHDLYEVYAARNGAGLDLSKRSKSLVTRILKLAEPEHASKLAEPEHARKLQANRAKRRAMKRTNRANTTAEGSPPDISYAGEGPLKIYLDARRAAECGELGLWNDTTSNYFITEYLFQKEGG
jgi:hypothetical protein